MAKKRTFSREFKAEAVRAINAGTKTVRQTALELGLRPDLIHKWRREMEARSEPVERGEALTSEEEIRRLRADLARVTEERDILKKATAFFAKESR